MVSRAVGNFALPSQEEGLESEESDARQSAHDSTGSRHSRTGSRGINQIQESVPRQEVNWQFRKDREASMARIPNPDAIIVGIPGHREIQARQRGGALPVQEREALARPEGPALVQIQQTQPIPPISPPSPQPATPPEFGPGCHNLRTPELPRRHHRACLTGPTPNFPEPETNPAETSASHPCRVHSLKLCPLLPKRVKGPRLSAEISAESPL
ncbi:unnamed protein product [Prunus armeniaca]